MDHVQHTRLTDAEVTEAVLNGATVYGPEDEKVGSVSEVNGSGGDARIVVEVGGFLGIGATSVIVPAHELSFARGRDGHVHGITSRSKDELREMENRIP